LTNAMVSCTSAYEDVCKSVTMKIPLRRIEIAREKTAAFLAFAFVLFAVLVPALHEHGNWFGRQPAASRHARSVAMGQTSIVAGSVLERPAVPTAADCPLCDWLVSATYVAGTSPAPLLFLALSFLLPALALCLPSLCARPSPRTATRAPPALLAA